MGKFKVGDHVKGISECGTVETNAEVVYVESGDYGDGLDIQIAGKDCDIWVNSKNFQLVDNDKPIVSSFVINGQEYTKEQYEKDCKRFLEAFPDEKSFDLSYAMENILNVYQWAQQNPVVTNLDHYAEEFGWTEEQEELVRKHICPFPFMGKESKFCPKQSSGITILCGECRKWWDQEWKGGKA